MYTIPVMLKAIQNVIFLGYSGWATWFVIWHLLGLGSYPPPSSLLALPSWCLGVGRRREDCTTHSRTGQAWQQGPQRSSPAAAKKGISWRVPTLPWRNHKRCWKSYKTNLLMCADVVNTGSTACSIRGSQEFLGPPLPLRYFCDHGQGAEPPLLILKWNRHKNNTFHF